MAANDTAALVVALSAQITKFEKDMKGAVDIAHRRTNEIETRFGAFNKKLQSEMSTFAGNMSRQLGPAGDALLALGPAGLAAAGAIGAIVLVATYANQQVNALAARAGQMRDFADTVELSVERVQALVVAGADVGLSSEKVESGIGRMVGALEELRNGSGKAYDAIRKISPELVVQLQQTRDTEHSIDLLAKAYARMDAAQRLTLSRGLFGRDPGQSRLLGQIAEAGSLAQLQSNLSSSITLTADQAKKMDDLRDASERLRNSAWEKFWSIGAVNVLQQQRDQADQLDRMATALRAISELDIKQSMLNFLGRVRGGLTGSAGTGGGGGWGDPIRPGEVEPPAVGTVPLPRSRPDDAPGSTKSKTAQLAFLREYNALLGDAITPREQLTLKELEGAAAIEQDARLRGAAVRGLAAYQAALSQAFVATLQRLGVATEQEVVESRLAQLQRDRIKFQLSENQVQQATVIILREAKQASEALEVRRAYLPGLKQLELDAKNVRKGLDEFGVNGLRSFEDGLVDIISRTKRVSDAFRDMANTIIKDIARMLVRQNITGPLAGFIGTAVSGLLGMSQPAAAAAAGYPVGFVGPIPGNLAGGTSNWQGGPTWVGEQGPELVNLPRGAQVIPNDVLRTMGGGGSVSAPITINMDARGADRDAIMRAVQEIRAEVPTIAVRAFNEARSRRII